MECGCRTERLYLDHSEERRDARRFAVRAARDGQRGRPGEKRPSRRRGRRQSRCSCRCRTTRDRFHHDRQCGNDIRHFDGNGSGKATFVVNNAATGLISDTVSGPGDLNGGSLTIVNDGTISGAKAIDLENTRNGSIEYSTTPAGSSRRSPTRTSSVAAPAPRSRMPGRSGPAAMTAKTSRVVTPSTTRRTAAEPFITSPGA